jgi:hypothetical protein
VYPATQLNQKNEQSLCFSFCGDKTFKPDFNSIFLQ